MVDENCVNVPIFIDLTVYCHPNNKENVYSSAVKLGQTYFPGKYTDRLLQHIHIQRDGGISKKWPLAVGLLTCELLVSSETFLLLCASPVTRRSCRTALTVQPFVPTLLSVHLAAISTKIETRCFSEVPLCWNFFCFFFCSGDKPELPLLKGKGGNEGNGRKSNKGSADDGGTE